MMKHKRKDKVREDISKELNIEHKVPIFRREILNSIVLYHDNDSTDNHKSDWNEPHND